MKRILVVVMALSLLFGPLGSTGASAAASPSWWNGAYEKRAVLSISTTDALASGYQVSVTINHSALVAAGALSTGNDLRLVHWNGTTWDAEQNRVLAVGSSWATGSTKIYFKIGAGIGASATDTSYYLYYGNSTPPAPLQNPNSVYDFFDDFSSGTVDSKWAVHMHGTGTLNASSGAAVASGTSDGTGTGHSLLTAAKFNNTAGLMVESDFKVIANDGGDYWGFAAGPADGAQSSLYADVGNDSYFGWGYRRNSDGQYIYMNNPSPPNAITHRTFNYHRIGQAITASNLPFSYLDGVRVASGAPTFAYNAHLYFQFDPYEAGNTYSAAFDNIVVRKFVANEPSVALAIDYVTGADNTVTVSVDPVFSFSVTGSAADCNGLTNTNGAAATASAVPLGHLASGLRVSSAQSLAIGTNSASGFQVYISSNSSNTPVMTGTAHPGNGIADVVAGPLPNALTEAFGYTTNDTGAGMVSGNVGPVPASTSSVTLLSAAAGVQSRTSCVGYFASVNSNTAADTYTVTVRYIAVPAF